jgi:hypothetical protein
MKLHEIAKQLDPQAKIKKWLDAQGIQNYTIRPDGIVDCTGGIQLNNIKSIRVPLQFGKVLGSFRCGSSPGTDLHWLPEYVGGHFDCSGTDLISLSGIDKTIKYIGGGFFGNERQTHLLGLLLIKGITLFRIDKGPLDDIMNKYVGTGDILSAQDELIDAGLIDQARL